MLLFLYFAYSFCAIVFGLEKVVSLTKTDSTWAMHGVEFLQYTLITVENGDNPNGFLSVIATDLSIVKSNASQAWITEKTGNYSLFRSTTLYGPRVTIGLGSDGNRNFAVIFQIASINEPIHNIAPLYADDQTALGTSDYNQLTSLTFLSAEATMNPVMECRVDYILAPNCSVDMFLGGRPGDEGRNKHRLLTFTNETINSYMSSLVYSRAVTFVVPENCTTMCTCRSGTRTLFFNSQRRAMGFYMSPEYPGVFDTERTDSYDGESDGWPGLEKFTVEVVAADPGATGNLQIQIGNTSKIFVRGSPSGTMEEIGDSLKITWLTSKDQKTGFLIRYSAVEANVTSATTATSTSTTTTTTTPSSPSLAMSKHFLFTIFFSCLLF